MNIDSLEYVTGEHRIYIVNSKNQEVAEVIFEEVEEDVYEITHTFVDDEYRGQGLAGNLMKMVYEELKSRGATIIPRCSYAQVWFENHIYNGELNEDDE